MSYEVILFMLLIVSTLTGIVTEALKKIFDEYGKEYHANTLAGAVSLVLSVAIGLGYSILIGAEINLMLAIYLIALVFLSWLCSMIGYDKVVQTISQYVSSGENVAIDENGGSTETKDAAAEESDLHNESEILTLTAEGLAEYTKAELKEHMDAAGIEYNSKMTKAQLIEAFLSQVAELEG